MDSVRASIGPALADRYSIERELGSGAMALVFLARDLKHDRQVAIKVLKPELANAIGADRFHREIEVVAGLSHPHILPLHDSGEAAGLLYFVMPYVKGESLRQRLMRERRLPIPDALRITREMADALGYAHRHGVIHRDVKPGNILLAEDHALLADFGVAHLVESVEETLTGTGLALGTPNYVSPEQATGERDVDGRSDIYALGCVLYETLTGDPPFAAPNARALLTKHLFEEPPRVQASRPQVSDGVELVVQTALQKDPGKRFQTAEEMAGSLDLVSGGFEAMAAAALRKLLGPRHRWLHGLRLASLVAAGVLLLAIGVLVVRSLARQSAFASEYPVYAVFPYEGGELSDAEVVVSGLAARSLYFHLLGWESITVVNGPSIEGPAVQLVRAGFGMPTRLVSAGLEYADRIDATHVIWLDANLEGDSVTLAARIHLANEEAVHETLTERGSSNDIDNVAAGLALQILRIVGQPAEIDDLKSRSPHPEAHRQHNDGRIALLEWRLADAEEFFLAAIEFDPEFALAHYELGVTMYWRTVRDPERILAGEAIAFHVGQADRFGDESRLRTGERRDLDAFKSFWAGDYEGARRQYAAILDREPTRLDMLVLSGAIEYEDPWLAADGRGRLKGPRGDLNRAQAVFDSAISLNSHVQLAWGRLFEIAREVALTANNGPCYAFLPPGGPLIPPYRFPEAAETRAYCPFAMNGSIHWRADSLTAAERETAIAEALVLRDQIDDRLEEWAIMQRDQARPHEELADWMLWERSVRGCDTDGDLADSLLVAARAHQERALEIRGDTTPEDRMRLGAVLLATGDVSGALRETNRALGELGGWQNGSGSAPPKLAANVYLANGSGHPTVEIMEAVDNEATWSIPDSTVEAEAIPGGPVWGTLAALRVLGLTGDDDAGIARRFRAVRRTWADMGYTERQQALLRFYSTQIVGPALLRNPEEWNEWFANIEQAGRDLPSVWQGLVILRESPEEAREHLREAIREVETVPAARRRATHYYMPIQLAEKLGDTATVSELAAAAAMCPLALDNIDFGWGMRRYLAGVQRD